MTSNNSIENALSILKENLQHIHTVTEWASEVGYSRTHFSFLIQRAFHCTPYKMIQREKYRKIQQLVGANPELKGIVVAQQVGFSDVKSLYKFLSRHFDTSLTTLRKIRQIG